MDPCPFVRILVGDLTLKFPSVSKPSFSTVHPSSSPCFCKIKLTNFPYQFSAVPLIVNDGAQNQDARSHSLNACFNLSKPQIENLTAKRPSLTISIYTGRRGATCGLNSAKLLGRVTVPLAELGTAESRPVVYHNGWIGIGGSKKNGSAQSQFFLSVRAEPDPRFVFKFDGEPECSPQVFQVQGNVTQPVFTCKFGFRSASDMQSRSMSEPNTPRNWAVPFMGSNQKEQSAKERKGWSLTIHDLSGSPVAAASMVTPFVASPGSQRVSRSNPGAWLILRPEDRTWKPWGRLEVWLERGGCDAVGYKFELLSTILANSTVSASNGGKFTIDLTSSLTPANSPHSSFDFGSCSGSSRPGSGSGSDFGFGLIPQLLQRGFVMSSTVEGIGKCSKPEVEVGIQHVTCTEDAAAYVALAAAMDLSMDACRPFSQKLRKELRQ